MSPAGIRFVVRRRKEVVDHDLPLLKANVPAGEYRQICEFISDLNDSPRSKGGEPMRNEWSGFVNAHVVDKYRVIWTYGDFEQGPNGEWVIPVLVERVGLKFPDWHDRGRTIYNDVVSIERIYGSPDPVLFAIEVRDYDAMEIWHFSHYCAFDVTSPAVTLRYGPPPAERICETCETLFGTNPDAVLRLASTFLVDEEE